MQEKQVPSGSTADPSLLAMTPLEDSRTEHVRRAKRKKSGRDWRRIRTFSLRGGLVVLALLILVGGFLFTKGYLKLHKVFKGGGFGGSP